METFWDPAHTRELRVCHYQQDSKTTYDVWVIQKDKSRILVFSSSQPLEQVELLVACLLKIDEFGEVEVTWEMSEEERRALLESGVEKLRGGHEMCDDERSVLHQELFERGFMDMDLPLPDVARERGRCLQGLLELGGHATADQVAKHIYSEEESKRFARPPSSNVSGHLVDHRRGTVRTEHLVRTEQISPQLNVYHLTWRGVAALRGWNSKYGPGSVALKDAYVPPTEDDIQ